jgi:hypothetical protein
MFKFLKSLFGKKEQVAATPAPYKIETPAQPVSEVNVDPVSVALDLEPVVIAVETNKAPKKPRAPKSSTPKAANPKLEKKVVTGSRGRKPKSKV